MVLRTSHALSQPEVYFAMEPGLTDEHSEVTDEQTRAVLAGLLDDFDSWIDLHGTREAVPVAAE